MKNKDGISLKVDYIKNKISIKEGVINVSDHSQEDSLVISVDDTNCGSEFVFDASIGLRKKAEKKQTVLTSILNTNTKKELIELFQDYGFFTKPDSQDYLHYSLKELNSTLQTLKDIILIKRECGSKNPNYEVLFDAYKDLLEHGRIAVVGNKYNDYDYDNDFVISLGHINPTRYWGGSFDYIVNVCHESFESEEDFENGIDFHDPITGKDINSKYISNPFSLTEEIPLYSAIEFLYNYIPFLGKPDKNSVLLFHYICLKKKYLDIHEITVEDLDSLAKNKLIEYSSELTNDYIKKVIESLPVTFDDKISMGMHLSVSDLLHAAFISILNTDFNRYVFDTCAKEGCTNVFIKSKRNKKSCYCCTAHARSEAQANYRKNHPKK